jgi:hypothetical protein
MGLEDSISKRSSLLKFSLARCLAIINYAFRYAETDFSLRTNIQQTPRAVPFPVN